MKRFWKTLIVVLPCLLAPAMSWAQKSASGMHPTFNVTSSSHAITNKALTITPSDTVAKISSNMSGCNVPVLSVQRDGKELLLSGITTQHTFTATKFYLPTATSPTLFVFKCMDPTDINKAIATDTVVVRRGS